VIDADALIRALGTLAAVGWGAGLIFAFLYGTVSPRLRRVVRKWAQTRDSLAEARKRIKSLEQTCIDFERELIRVDKIRKRTDDHYIDLRRRYEDTHQDRRAA
jgi:septal ring factor EnvC (AmiA/AmiB activator)